jgi:PAS domain S-box-containing protein
MRPNPAFIAAPSRKTIGGYGMDGPEGFATEGLELLDVGVAVFDSDSRLMFANKAFRAMRSYPDDVCREGVTLKELMLFNAQRGDFGPGDPVALADERLAEITASGNREVEREMADGQILGIKYRRTGSGGLVITFEDRTAERRAKAALKASEERYALVAEAAEESIYEWSIAEERFFASPRLTAFVGRDLGEDGVRNWEWTDLIHPEDQQQYRETLLAHLSGKEPRWDCRYRLKDAKGDWRWVSDHGTSIRDEDGKAVRMIAAIRDITEEVEKDAALAASEELHMLVSKATADGIYDWNVTDDVLYVSDNLTSMLYADMDAKGSKSWNDRVHPDDYPAYVDATRAHFKGEADGIDCEYRVNTQSGGYRWVHDRGVGVRDEDGRVTRLVGAVRDITEMKEAKAEIERTEARLMSSLATISDGILLVDSDHRVQLWNDRYYEIFTDAVGGADISEVIVKGRSFFDMIRDGYNLGMFKPHPEGVDAWVEARVKAWDQPVSMWELELANGTWILLNERQMPDGGRVSVYTDVTEFKRREQEALAARQRFEDAIEAISTGFALFDADDRLVLWNSRFRDYFAEMADVFVPGAKFRDMLGAAIKRGLIPAATDDMEGFLDQIIEDRIRGVGSVRENRLSDGLWLQIRDHRTRDGGLVSIYTDVTDLKNSEQDAQAARERFEEAIEAISSGFALFDAEDRLVLWNSRFRQYFSEVEDVFTPGVPFRDMLAATIKRGLFPSAKEDPEGFLDALLAKRAKGVGQIRENVLSDGLWLQIRDHRTKDGGMVSIYTDVTELKTSEQKAQAARERFEEAVEAISSGFTLWDKDDRLVISNSRYREFYQDLADIVKPGARFRDILLHGAERGLLPDAKDDPAGYVEENARKREAAIGTLREHRLANGKWLQVTDHRTADGGIVSIHTDVTELKNREEEIRQKSAILEATLENMGQGITMVDNELRTVAFNKKFFELMEWPEERFGRGFTMEEAFRFNAERGEYGPGDIEEQVRQRVELAKKFEAHRFERTRPDGTVLEIVGNPIEGGGLVATYTDITERKMADEALKAALEEFNAVIDSIDYGVLFMGPDLHARICNRAFREIWNIPEGFVDENPSMRALIEYNRDKGVYDVAPEEWDGWINRRIEAIRAGSIPPGEMVRADGKVLRYQCVALPDGGRMLTYFDVTDLKRAEQEVRERETRLRATLDEFNAVLDNVDYGVILFDKDLRARVVNRVMLRMWNFPESFMHEHLTMREMMDYNRDTGLYEVEPEGWDAWVEARIEKVRAGGMPPAEMRRGDGTILAIQCVDLPDGGRMLTYFDITELKRAEQVVRESEARLRGILENSPIGVAVVGDDNIIRFHNPRFAEILGGPGQDLVGTLSNRFWTDLEERKRSMEIFRKEGRVREREVMYRGIDGSDVWSQSTYEKTEWEGISARLIWIYDVTEEKANREALVVARDEAEAALADLTKAQERLVQSEKMASLGQLTAGIAHEIKNPLNFVNNFAKLSDELLEELHDILAEPIKTLGEEERDDAEDLMATVRENLGKINEHGRRADSIVKNMLLHSREGPSEQQKANVNAIAEEALNLAYHGARAENPKFNIEMTTELDENAGEIECFPQDLMRVFLNLITNGMYAAHKRGTLEAGSAPSIALTTRASADRVEIEVRDNGSGIPPDVAEKIFVPFFTTKPAGEGTGLGLSLSYDIVVKQHGGELTVESTPGEFTAFKVVLPRTLPASSEEDR